MTAKVKKFIQSRYYQNFPTVPDLEEAFLKWLNENPEVEVIWVDRGRGEDYSVWTVFYRE